MQLDEIVTKSDLQQMEQRILKQISRMASMNVHEDKYLNLDEAAAVIKLKNRRAMWRKLQSGEIPYIRDGKEIKVLRSDLDEYMMSLRISSDGEIISASLTM